MIHELEWWDQFLRWNASDYGGIDEVIVFQRDVWLPDLFVENTAQSYRELGNDAMLISVKDDGLIVWEPGIVVETSCAVNIMKYPFDSQVCDIRFLTWMHTNRTLSVKPGHDSIHLDATLPNGEWDITQTRAEHYTYPSTYRAGTHHTGVRFFVHLRRKRTFYILNTIIPVVMLSLLNVLVFILPADCGERMALAVTVLLSFTVYLGIISDVMPKTSESLSVLAVYLTSLLSISTLSVGCAGIVLNIHHKDPDTAIPRIVKYFLGGHRRNLHPQMGDKICDSDNLNQETIIIHSQNKVKDESLDCKCNKSSETEMNNVAGHCTPHECSRLVREVEDVRSLDITWHVIGKSLDGVLFWVFFIVTNTITGIVLSLFVS
ncbi:neuronal acetylcholine receptor subunit beta-3-like [Gigantopelta aegis]|uniref:neuronal acetylcholine receptor subunit beta-3-like n=1 Tax=Gigantopelta aegis TaxID=1735272 RepID=UPI001B88A600|nr:neuronal acetylcholine receptor subunit beta-3-like [Gigantopelta aegis]